MSPRSGAVIAARATDAGRPALGRPHATSAHHQEKGGHNHSRYHQRRPDSHEHHHVSRQPASPTVKPPEAGYCRLSKQPRRQRRPPHGRPAWVLFQREEKMVCARLQQGSSCQKAECNTSLVAKVGSHMGEVGWLFRVPSTAAETIDLFNLLSFDRHVAQDFIMEGVMHTLPVLLGRPIHP